MKPALVLLLALALLPLVAGCGAEELSAKPARPEQQNAAAAKAAQIERGRYLVGFGGCNDCHTPFKLGPNGPEPDMERALSGHPAGMVMPAPPEAKGPWLWMGAATNTAFAGPWGISYARNLTPHPVSGLGIWNEEMFLRTMRTGRHMGVSRPLLPPMPWQSLNSLNDEDLKAVFAYLRSIKPIDNEVPEPVIHMPPAPAAKG